MDCDAGWQAEFAREERRLSGNHEALPAPTQLALVKGSVDYWHIFFLNGAGERYFEATMQSETKLRSWANACLKVAGMQWREAPVGMFNKPWQK